MCGKSKLSKINVLSCYEIHSDLKTHARLVVKPVPILGYSIHCTLVLRLQGTLKDIDYPPKNKKAIINLL
jgi:hypothetical protein